MHSMTRTLGPLAILLSVTGCRKTETVPTYLVVPRIDVQATDEQGGNTSKITEAWVTVDDRSVGVWELPARVPVIGTGTHTIGITAGIRRNGSFDDRQRYPYYTSWQTTTELDQFGVHYIDLDLRGPVTITFAGDTLTNLIDSPPPSGEQMWYAPAQDETNARLTAVFDLSSLASATLNFAAWYDLEDIPGSGMMFKE